MNPEQYEKLGRRRIVQGDLFGYPNIVIPIKTHGRWYGSISQAVASMVPFPKLTLYESRMVPYGEKNLVFVALWNDSTPYSHRHISDCTCSAILTAAQANLDTLAMPLLGGNEGHKYIHSMEWPIHCMEDRLESSAMIPPEVIFVTR